MLLLFQIIDPHYELDMIAEPDSKLLRWFYRMARRINTSLAARTTIFLAVAALVGTSAILDVVSEVFPAIVLKFSNSLLFMKL